MITDKCPSCGKEYQWDAERDTYLESMEVLTIICTGLESTDLCRYLCTAHDGRDHCGGVIAVEVNDKYGSTVYIPSTKEL